MLKMIASVLVLFATLATSAFATPFSIPSHVDDGVIVHNSFGTGGYDTQNTTQGALTIGGAGTSTTRTPIMFFELPEPGTVNSAMLNLNLTLNDPGNAGQHADLWGLGYQSTTVIQNVWSLEGNSDPNAIGGGLGIADRVKLQDNLIDGFMGNPTLPFAFSTDATGNANLAAFVQSLYDAGAQMGDYAVLRMNADFNVTTFDRWNISSGDSLSPLPPTLLLDITFPVPEPSSFMLLGLGALGLARHTRRRRR